MANRIIVDRTTSFTYETVHKIIGKRYRLQKKLKLKPEIPIGTEFYVEHGLINHEGCIFAVISCQDRRQYLTEYGQVYSKDWHSDWFDVIDFNRYFLPRGSL